MTDILFAYGRREAIRDGELIDVSDAAEQAGYLMAVAMTRAVWRRYVQVPPGGRTDSAVGDAVSAAADD